VISGVLGGLFAKIHHQVVLDLLKHILVVILLLLSQGCSGLCLLFFLAILSTLFVFLILNGCGHSSSLYLRLH